MDCATGGTPALQQPFAEGLLEQTDALAHETAAPCESDAWRHEVAARLERYRARRKPRAPRYPSLFLPFEQPEHRTRTALAPNSAGGAPAVSSLPNVDSQIHEQPLPAAVSPDFSTAVYEDPDLTGKIIEFPRSAAIPVVRGPELADPVLDRPRIIEAPEMAPPPPAMGGILMEAPAIREADTKPHRDAPISSATISQRFGAWLVDGSILGAALAASAAIFARLNPDLPAKGRLFGGLAGASVLLWCVYEFLFVVYTGSTPGLRALKLRLARFDGSAAHRRSRCWRVLACFLSAFSLGLGYLWGLIDEDGLCWHDRISRTHIQYPRPLNK